EADHSVSLGGWYRKTAARVLQPATAHPADPVLDRVEYRQKHVTLCSQRSATERDVVVRRMSSASLPQRFGLAQEPVDGVNLLNCRGAAGRPDVHLGLGGDGNLVDPDGAGLELGRA